MTKLDKIIVYVVEFIFWLCGIFSLLLFLSIVVTIYSIFLWWVSTW